MADNIFYRFIENHGDYFPPGYYGDDFLKKVQSRAGLTTAQMKELATGLSELRPTYDRYVQGLLSTVMRPRDAILRTHQFHTALLQKLGYPVLEPYREFVTLEDGGTAVVPVRHIVRRGERPAMFIMEMQDMVKRNSDEGERPGLFEQQYDQEEKNSPQQQYRACQWQDVFTVPDRMHISPAIINRAIDAIFLLPEQRRPEYILLMAGNRHFLLNAEKWMRGAWLEFSLDELFAQGASTKYRLYYALFHLLTSRASLVPDADEPLMNGLIADGYRNAFAVTQDLKRGVIAAVETIAEETLHQLRQEGREPAADDRGFADRVKDDCLTLVYRLLFIFYAESRPELSILPVDDPIYRNGYSLEMLRDMELTRLNTAAGAGGYFMHDSLERLFSLLREGYNYPAKDVSRSFSVRKIDSPLFRRDALREIGGVRLRNQAWQKVINALSLTTPGARRQRGRISYATLGLNQLGSVYESLLAYRGFYAAEELIEVVKAGENPEKDGSYLVPRTRIDDFKDKEVVRDAETGEVRIYEPGRYIYRLNGRDRQKSASYYTPEVLTRSTVKYALREHIQKVSTHREKAEYLLTLKIHEPAMGAAAFQNEVVNQLADAYIKFIQIERGKNIPSDRIKDATQRVKTYIATRNVYGTDLNPTAVELGRLSLWLSVMYRNMAVPFFAGRVATGNAVVGAYLRTFSPGQVITPPLEKAKKWWENVPTSVHLNKRGRDKKNVYNFLLPDASMLAAADNKEFKAEYPNECKTMTNVLTGWTKPIDDSEYKTLLALSAKVDALLKLCYEEQRAMDRLTEQSLPDVYAEPKEDHLAVSEVDYLQKQQLLEARSEPGSPYSRLRDVMDYWCALFFWPPEKADLLPTRDQYWHDLDAMLGKVEGLEDAPMRPVQLTLFDSVDRDGNPTASEKSIELADKEQLLALGRERHGWVPAMDAERRALVHRLRTRYRFFHPQLEFIEVFREHGGFDIIAGNPPWLKLEFNETSVISEIYPEVMIRKMSAPKVSRMRQQFMTDEAMATLLHSEMLEHVGTTAFLNAVQCYPYMAGQQPNLYKCVLEASMAMASPDNGYIGLLCPDGMYTDPKGAPMRKAIYPRLRYHFQYQNMLKLFSEVDGHTVYSTQVLGPQQKEISFASISNLYMPQTVEDCLPHDGYGAVPALKDANGKWNTTGHKARVVHVTRDVLALMADVFEADAEAESAKLVSVHAQNLLPILEKLRPYPRHLKDTDCRIERCFDETNAPKAGLIKSLSKHSQEADIEAYELIYKAPQFNLGNPFAQMPREYVSSNSAYDPIDLLLLDPERPMRTQFVPGLQLPEYRAKVPGFVTGQDAQGKPVYDSFIDYYKVAFRRNLSNVMARTLICAVLPRKTAHIHGVESVAFRSAFDAVDMASFCMTLPLDFYIKVMQAGDLFDSRMQLFPVGVPERFQAAMYARTLVLNCLTPHYAELWEECWRPEYAAQTWSRPDDARLTPFSRLGPVWNAQTPLRGEFERRQALVELDVLAAMALGLTLEDLLLMYDLIFPVLRQNEAATFYDADGDIVYTTRSDLRGVGVDRKTWEEIRDEEPPFEITVPEERNGLYPDRTVRHRAPYRAADRRDDYRTAWAHFRHLL